MDKKLAKNEFINKMIKNEKIQDNDPILSFIRDDYDFLSQCSRNYPSAILYANENLQMSLSFISEALKKQPNLILHLPKQHRDDFFIADIVLRVDPYLFNIFSSKIRSDPSIYNMVLYKSIQQIKFIPKKTFASPSFKRQLQDLVFLHEDIYNYIPKKLKTSDMLAELTKSNGAILLSIPQDLITNELLSIGINSNIDCIIILNNNLPQIDKLKVLENTISTLIKFKTIPEIDQFINFYYQETHVQSLVGKINNINKEEQNTSPKRKI